MKTTSSPSYPGWGKLIVFFSVITSVCFLPLSADITERQLLKEVKRNIHEVNSDIQRVSIDHENDHQLSINYLNNDRNLYTQFYSHLKADGMSFEALLGPYKPEQVSWNSFKPLNHHNIDPQNVNELEAFLGYAEDKLDILRNQQKKTQNLAHEIAANYHRNHYYYGKHKHRYYYPYYKPYKYYHYNRPYYYKQRYYYKPYYYRHNYYYKPYYYKHRQHNKSGVYFNVGPYGPSAGFHIRIK